MYAISRRKHLREHNAPLHPDPVASSTTTRTFFNFPWFFVIILFFSFFFNLIEKKKKKKTRRRGKFPRGGGRMRAPFFQFPSFLYNSFPFLLIFVLIFVIFYKKLKKIE